MKEKSNFLKSSVLPAILLVLSVTGTFFFYASRATWVFMDITVGFEQFAFLLLCIMIANTVLLGALSFFNMKKDKNDPKLFCNKKAYRVLLGFSGVIGVILFVFSMIFSLSMAFSESGEVYWLYFRKSLFKGAFLTMLPCFVLFFEKMGKKAKAAVGTAAIVAVFAITFFEFYPAINYRITSEPTVFDTGKNYSVVFSVSSNGTGFVEYNYEGKDYKVFDESGGRLNSSSKIHSVNIPYEHLENNSYKIGSTQVTEQYSYGSRTGKEVVSGEYNFVPAKGSNMTCLVISDWHTRLGLAKDAIGYAGDYDSVILLGDSTPGVDFEEQVVNNIVRFAGDVSKGTKPVLFVRGNHETRGEYAGEILGALGLDEFYYTARMGEFSFVVLDSGEDKDDSHPEYGGMTDYNTYRAKMIEWLSGVEPNNEKVIALSHSWKISDVENELSEKGWNELDRLGARLMISGHTHQCRLIGEADEREKEVISAHPEITGYMDGGHTDGVYTASKLTLTDKDILIEAFNNSGEKVFEHKLDW